MILFLRVLLAISLAALVWTALAAPGSLAWIPNPPWDVDWFNWMFLLIVGWVLSVLHDGAIYRRVEEEMLRDAEWYEEDYRSWYK